MKTQHTPAPWRYEERGQMVWAKSVGGCMMEESDFLLADIRGWGHLQYLPNGEAIQDANGRLVAAAPDLLEALQVFMSAGVGNSTDFEIQRQAYRMAVAAIKKATS